MWAVTKKKVSIILLDNFKIYVMYPATAEPKVWRHHCIRQCHCHSFSEVNGTEGGGEMPTLMSFRTKSTRLPTETAWERRSHQWHLFVRSDTWLREMPLSVTLMVRLYSSSHLLFQHVFCRFLSQFSINFQYILQGLFSSHTPNTMKFSIKNIDPIFYSTKIRPPGI